MAVGGRDASTNMKPSAMSPVRGDVAKRQRLRAAPSVRVSVKLALAKRWDVRTIRFAVVAVEGAVGAADVEQVVAAKRHALTTANNPSTVPSVVHRQRRRRVRRRVLALLLLLVPTPARAPTA
jgi:hypothetical protein